MNKIDIYVAVIILIALGIVSFTLRVPYSYIRKKGFGYKRWLEIFYHVFLGIFVFPFFLKIPFHYFFPGWVILLFFWGFWEYLHYREIYISEWKYYLYQTFLAIVYALPFIMK